MRFILILTSAIHSAVYKATRGRLGGRNLGTNVLLLKTTGRRTGKSRTTPLGWFGRDNGYVLVASNAGLGTHPAWYHNLVSNPNTTVQVGREIVPVTAEVLRGEARTRAWQEVIATAPAYSQYAKQTRREIPLILLRPGE